MNFEEKLKLLRDMQIYGNMYYTFLNISDIAFSDSIPTLCVRMGDSEHINMQINESYWNILSDRQKQFVIAHECLHVMLSHLNRLKLSIDNGAKVDREIINIAMDVCVNETLVRSYGFIRTEIDRGYYWLDNTFEDPNIKYGANMEYYYEMLYKSYDTAEGGDKTKRIGAGGTFVDEHGSWESISEESVQKIIESMSEDELKKLKKLVEVESDIFAGNQTTIIDTELQKYKIVKKRKWEDVIKRWVSSKLKEEDSEQYQWAKMDRRFSLLKNEFVIPHIGETEHKNKDKMQVAFYLDVSGSCHSYAQRFFNSANSVPTKYFDIRFFSFDTVVREIDIENRHLKVGGGTSFSIIEKSALQDYKKYPDAIFILTDGYGTNVVPKIPERWYWFLTVDYTTYVPKKCNKFLLRSYE